MKKESRNNLNWDFIYKEYLRLVSNKLVVETLNLPFSANALSEHLNRRGYKLRTRIEKNLDRKWSKEKRKLHGKIMQDVVKRVPEKYLGYYKSGRIKTFKGIDSFGKKCCFIGSWEMEIATLLTENNILWQKEPHSFEYEYLENVHLYYPDFYLPEYKCYIEVKGIETERDHLKWKNIPLLLVISGSKEFYKYKTKKYNIKEKLLTFLKSKTP